jgi:hypothetical protein
MKKTLQDQYLLIKEGKGHKGVFLTEAKREFPHIVRNAATFDEAVASLKTKNIILENVLTVMPAIMDRPKKESYETAFEAFLAEARKKENEDEKVKAEEKKVSKPVEEDLSKNFDYSDEKNPDNMIFDQIMMGYYAEMKDPKNADKTMQELKDIVFKNLSKNQIYYTENAQFGVKDLGYSVDHPGLGEPKEPKGKYKSSGYGDLNESIGRNYPGELEGEYEGELQKIYGVDIYDTLKDVLDISNSEDDFINKMTMSLTDETNTLPESSEEKLRIWYRNNTLNLEEAKLRKVIREMINEELEEAYQMPSINTANISGAEGGKRFIPKQLPFPQNVRKRFGEHIVYNPASNTLYVSQILYINLIKGYGDQPAIKKLIMDIPPMVKQILNKPDNYGPTTNLPKEFKVYHPLNAEVEKAKADKFNKAGDKQYWAEGDLLIPNLNVMEGEVESLHESVEKDLADINKEAEHEVLQSKLDKIDALIDLRRSKLGKLDEDEDMKALTDKKKVKELEKDIKKLEVARNKVEKMMSKFKGKKSSNKKVIDETEEDLDLDVEYVEDATERLDAGQNVGSIGDTYNNMGRNQKSDLIDYLNTIAPDDLKSDYVY